MTNNTININAVMKHKGDKDPIWSVKAERGEIVECMTPEGRSTDFVCTVHLRNWYTGSHYILNTPIFGKTESFDDEDFGLVECYVNAITRTESLVSRIQEKGVVNLDNWKDIKETYNS